MNRPIEIMEMDCAMQFTLRVWWRTNRPDNQALVLARLPYRGRYTEWFDAVLRLEAPGTRYGWVEQAVRLSDVTFNPLKHDDEKRFVNY